MKSYREVFSPIFDSKTYTKDDRCALVLMVFFAGFLPWCCMLIAPFLVVDSFNAMLHLCFQKSSDCIQTKRVEFGEIIEHPILSEQLEKDRAFILLTTILVIFLIATSPMRLWMILVLLPATCLTMWLIWKSTPWIWHSMYRIRCEVEAGIEPNMAPISAMIAIISLFFPTVLLSILGGSRIKLWIQNLLFSTEQNFENIYPIMNALFLMIILTSCCWAWVFYHREELIANEKDKIETAKEMKLDQN